VHLRINSPGGDVFAGQAMAQAIREYSGRIVAHIDGLAASAVSWVALAASEVLIAPGGMVMIHKAMTFAAGNADELKATAALLDKIDSTLIDGYVRETNQSIAQITDWMTAETWFTADEAVKYGFADRIAEPAADSATPAARWNLAAYDHAPAGCAVPSAAAPVAAHSIAVRRLNHYDRIAA
jgi:ATP-dependent Clp protease protease subunit